MYKDKFSGPVNNGELYEQASGLFKDRQNTSAVLSHLYRKSGLVDRDESTRPYGYELNEDGWELLNELGAPDTTYEGKNVDVEIPELDEFETEQNVNLEQGPDLIDDADARGEDPGPFESAKARRRFFAEKKEKNYLEWLRQEWKPEHTIEDEASEMAETVGSADADGDVSFEGIDEAMEDFLDDEEQEEIELVEFDPDPNGHSPRWEEPEEEETHPELPDTIDLSPDWDWLGTQLVKMGFPGMAKMAYEEELPKSLVYTDVLNLLFKHRFDADVDLDVETRGLSVVESPADEDEVQHFKSALGVAT